MPKPPKAPPKKVKPEAVIFRLSPDGRASLREIADAEQRPIAWVVRRLIEAELNRLGKKI